MNLFFFQSAEDNEPEKFIRKCVQAVFSDDLIKMVSPSGTKSNKVKFSNTETCLLLQHCFAKRFKKNDQKVFDSLVKNVFRKLKNNLCIRKAARKAVQQNQNTEPAAD
jgi:hypothetical protein